MTLRTATEQFFIENLSKKVQEDGMYPTHGSMRSSVFCYCSKSVIYLFSAKLVLKKAIERRNVFKSHPIDEPSALGFSFNFTVGHGFDLKKGWEMGFIENLG